MTGRVAIIILGSLAMMIRVGAHHSTANFDRSKATAITGVVTQFQFTNPHSLIEMDVAGEAGSAPSQYKVFATSKVVLLRYGWRPDSVQPGDSISIVGYPDRDDAKFLYLTGIEFADGSEWSRSDILE